MGCGRSSTAAATGAPGGPGSPRDAVEVPSDPVVQERRASQIAILEGVASTNLSSGVMSSTPSATMSSRIGASRCSQSEFADPNQTIIIFDWDDTLCPSYWIRTHPELEWFRKAPNDPPIQNALRMLSDQVVLLLQLASRLGKIVLVTNAMRPWVDTSIANFLPRLQAAMKGIPTLYALEHLKKLEAEGFDAKSNSALTEVKARAMKEVVTDFYSRYANQSWKNLITIGDGLFEHEAIRQVALERPHQDPVKKCRIKTVKLLEGPTIAGLIVEVSIVRSWLAKIVQLNGDLGIDLSSDEAIINDWDEQFREDQMAETAPSSA